MSEKPSAEQSVGQSSVGQSSVVVHNRSQRVIHTSKGTLPIGGSLEVDAIEAKSLLDYPGIVDASKLVPHATQSIEKLKSQVRALDAEVANLREENAALKAELDGLKKTADEEAPAPKEKYKGKR